MAFPPIFLAFLDLLSIIVYSDLIYFNRTGKSIHSLHKPFLFLFNK